MVIKTRLMRDTHLLDTVFYGDSADMAEIPDEFVDLIITSPPYYNIKDYSLDGHQLQTIGIKDERQIGDISDYEHYLSALLAVWQECFRVLKPNGKIAVNAPLMPLTKATSNTHYNRDILNIAGDIDHSIRTNISGLFLYDLYIWNRTNPSKKLMFGSYPYPRNFYAQNTAEFIYVYVKEGNSINSAAGDVKEASKLTEAEWIEYTGQVWNIPIPGKSDLAFGKHCAIMPEEIARRLIKLFTFVCDVVLDPFTGSGTTLKVAKELDRKYIGYELSDSFKEVIELKLGLKNVNTEFSTSPRLL